MGWILCGASFSYFFSSLVAGTVLARWGVGLLLGVSSLLVVCSTSGYGLAPAWILFACSSLFHGLGSGAIDAGLNHYVAHHFAARHMTWLHACYSIGATMGPLIMTAGISRFQSWRMGYLMVAGLLFALSCLFFVTRKQWDATPHDEMDTAKAEDEQHISLWQALQHKLVRLQMLIFFVYTGLEVTVGQWSFTLLKEARGLTPQTAGLWVSLYWGSIVVGRIVSGFVVERWGIDRLLRISMMCAVIGALAFAATSASVVSALALAIMGLGLSAIFPCLMTRTPQRLRRALAAHAIGFQVGAAMLGAAALPSLTGLSAQFLGLETIALAVVTMAVLLLLMHEWLLHKDATPLRKGS